MREKQLEADLGIIILIVVKNKKCQECDWCKHKVNITANFADQKKFKSRLKTSQRNIYVCAAVFGLKIWFISCGPTIQISIQIFKTS